MMFKTTPQSLMLPLTEAEGSVLGGSCKVEMLGR
jgi:hypothetical protein